LNFVSIGFVHPLLSKHYCLQYLDEALFGDDEEAEDVNVEQIFVVMGTGEVCCR